MAPREKCKLSHTALASDATADGLSHSLGGLSDCIHAAFAVVSKTHKLNGSKPSMALSQFLPLSIQNTFRCLWVYVFTRASFRLSY